MVNESELYKNKMLAEFENAKKSLEELVEQNKEIFNYQVLSQSTIV